MIPRCVGLFAKPAQAGRVKTRLVPPLTAEEAARLYQAFLADAAITLGSGAPGWEWRVFSTDPEAQRAAWPPDVPAPAAWHAQEGADLGARLLAAFTRLRRDGAELSVIVGSDHPTLPRSAIERAFRALGDADLVLGPALDGGYYLIGLREPAPDLFRDIPWSTAGVFPRTLERAAALGLRVARTEPAVDVDRPEDLVVIRQLLDTLARSGDPTGARTRRVLAALPGAAG
jgi:rSAM/selenodomain-associated transferase 1